MIQHKRRMESGPEYPMPMSAESDKIAVELEDAEDAASRGWIDELDSLRLLEIAEQFRQAGRYDEAKRADILAGRTVWAGARETESE